MNLFKPLLIFTITLISFVDHLNAFCPSKCVCDESKATCTNSQFNVLPIMLNPWLKELYMGSNQIKKVTPLNSVYNEIEVLDLSNNQIDHLEDNIFNGLSKLKVLKLNGNKITNLTRNSFKGLDTLEHLVLSNNRIREINANTFTHLKNLKRLDLADNQISNLDSEIFIGQTNLVDLNLSNNNLLFSNLTIDLNPIKSDYLVNLVSLSLAGNHLVNLTRENSPFSKSDQQEDTLDQLQQPAYLQLKSQNQFNDQNAQYTIYSKLVNQIVMNNRRPYLFNQRKSLQPVAERRVIFKKWGNLRELDISHTQLNLVENDALSSLTQLQVLKIRNNRLMDIQSVLKEFISLKMLDISHNPIVQLDKNTFYGLQQLETLNISDCGSLQAINDQAFNGLSKLQRLDINWCPKLTALDPSIFQSLASLKQLYLRGNSLQSLDDKIVNNAFNLEILDIRQNPLYCDCNLKWLVNVLRMYANQSTFNLPSYIPFAEQQQQLRFELSQVYCSGPSELKGKLVSDLTNEELNCIDLRLIVFICCGVFVGIIIVAVIILCIWMCMRYGGNGKCSTFSNFIKRPFTADTANRQIGFKTTSSLSRPSTAQRTLHKLLGTGNLYQTDKTFNVINGKPEFTWLPSTNCSNTSTNKRFTNTLSNYGNNSTLIFNSNQASTICPSMMTTNNYFNNQRNESTIITNLNGMNNLSGLNQHRHLATMQPIDTYDCNSYLHHNYATLYETLNSPVNEHYGSSSMSTTTTLSSANQSQNSNTNLVVPNNMRNQSLRYQQQQQHTCLQTWNPSFQDKSMTSPMINGTTPKSSI